jgi:hypothetical protein
MSVDSKNWLNGAQKNSPLARAFPSPASQPPAEIQPDNDQEEESHASRAYGGLRSRRDRAHTLELRFLNSQRPDETLDYNHLPRVQWRKSTGEIVLLYNALGVTVVIRGLNLWELKERIRQHLVTWVQEQGDDPLVMHRGMEEAKREGRDFVLVQEISFEEQEREGDVML